MKRTYLVSNIEWDTDGDTELLEQLPTETTLEIDLGVDAADEDDVLDLIADELSDIYGYCHFGFTCKEA